MDTTINIDTFSYQKIGEELDLSVGLTLSNSDKEKYDFEFSTQQSYEREVQHTDDSISYDFDSDSSVDFAINDLYKRFGYVFHGEAKISKNSDPLRNTKDYNVTPVGVKYEFDRDYFNSFSLSFHPQLNHAEFTSENFDESTYDFVSSKKHETRWYYSLRLQSQITFYSDKISYTTDSWYRNSPDTFGGGDSNEKKIRASTDHEITYAINQYISFGYSFLIDYDKRREVEQQLPKVDVENGFTLQISF